MYYNCVDGRGLFQEPGNFKNAQKCYSFSKSNSVWKLVSKFAISDLRSASSKLRKFANCAEHIHAYSNYCSLLKSFHVFNFRHLSNWRKIFHGENLSIYSTWPTCMYCILCNFTMVNLHCIFVTNLPWQKLNCTTMQNLNCQMQVYIVYFYKWKFWNLRYPLKPWTCCRIRSSWL